MLFVRIIGMVFVSLCLLLIVSLGVVIWFMPRSSSANPVSVGTEGLAVETFAREGFVLVQGELWRAHNREGVIEKGDAVVVVGYSGGLVIEIIRKI